MTASQHRAPSGVRDHAATDKKVVKWKAVPRLILALVVVGGCAAPDPSAVVSAEDERLNKAETLVLNAVDTTMSAWDTAAAAALTGPADAFVPDGTALVVIDRTGHVRTDGLALPFLPSVPAAERPARDAIPVEQRGGLAIAEVIADGWRGWQAIERGRTAEARGSSGVAIVWRSGPERLAIAAGPIALLIRSAAPQLTQIKVRAGVENPAVSSRPAGAGERIVPLKGPGLSWVVRLTALK